MVSSNEGAFQALNRPALRLSRWRRGIIGSESGLRDCIGSTAGLRTPPGASSMTIESVFSRPLPLPPSSRGRFRW